MSLRQRWRAFRHHTLFPAQLDLGIAVLRATGDTERCARQERTLASAPPGSVGHGLRRLLCDRGISLVPGYQHHDLKHLLLGFDLSAVDEMRMQAFMTGNAGVGRDTLLGLAFLVYCPEMWAEIPRLLLAGAFAAPVADIDFDRALGSDLDTLRASLRVDAAFARADRVLAAMTAPLRPTPELVPLT